MLEWSQSLWHHSKSAAVELEMQAEKSNYTALWKQNIIII